MSAVRKEGKARKERVKKCLGNNGKIKENKQRPFHKTLPKTSGFISQFSIRFCETDSSWNKEKEEVKSKKKEGKNNDTIRFVNKIFKFKKERRIKKYKRKN